MSIIILGNASLVSLWGLVTAAVSSCMYFYHLQPVATELYVQIEVTKTCVLHQGLNYKVTLNSVLVLVLCS